MPTQRKPRMFLVVDEEDEEILSMCTTEGEAIDRAEDSLEAEGRGDSGGIYLYTSTKKLTTRYTKPKLIPDE